MIQRIQSIYLLLAIITIILAFVFPLYALINQTAVYISLCHVLEQGKEMAVYWQNYVLATSGTLILILQGITLFTYRKRKVQMNLLKGCFLLFALSLAIMFSLGGRVGMFDGGSLGNELIGILSFVLSWLFSILAFRGIAKDEALVRSSERLR